MITADSIKAAFVAARLNGSNMVLLNVTGMRTQDFEHLIRPLEVKDSHFQFIGAMGEKASVEYESFFGPSRDGLSRISNGGVITGIGNDYVVLEVGCNGFDAGLWVGFTITGDIYKDNNVPVITYNGE